MRINKSNVCMYTSCYIYILDVLTVCFQRNFSVTDLDSSNSLCLIIDCEELRAVFRAYVFGLFLCNL